ncbi:MAG: endonuclease/exonuclease/phosphatase family protein [Verrucomicrobiales bacterium]
MEGHADALLPDRAATEEPGDWFSAEELEVVRLSSKSHWDVPVEVDGEIVHVLVCHPTPPVFDGAEDRNGRRNHDEIRLWADYVQPEKSRYIYDDKGVRGGLAAGSMFAILGDMNADPFDGDSAAGAILQLLDNPAIDYSKIPSSAGGKEAAATQGGVNRSHKGQPEYDTGDFSDSGTGNLHIDYVLPSKAGWNIKDSAVFWPEASDPSSRLLSVSDHRMVYVDLEFASEPSTPALPNVNIRHSVNQSELTWAAQPGVVYELQTSNDLQSDSWSAANEIEIVIDPLTQTAVANDPAPLPMRFYRIALEPR